MASYEIEPKLGSQSFSCPHCNAVAHQDWFSFFVKPENASEVVVLTPERITVNTLQEGERNDIHEIDQFIERLKKNDLTYEYRKYPHALKVRMVNLHISSCHSCNGFALWVRDRLVFPTRAEKTPDLVEQDLEEATTVLNQCPAGAAALIRVCIQKLVPLLRQEGKNLDEYISSLVRKGLEVEIQQAMEALQVLRNDTVQLTNFDSDEDRVTALKFFDSLKTVLERRMLK